MIFQLITFLHIVQQYSATSLLAPILKEIQRTQLSHGQNFEKSLHFLIIHRVRTLRTTPLPPPLRKWSAIFGFALLVLEGGGANIETGQTVNNTATWNGAKLWENVLENC